MKRFAKLKIGVDILRSLFERARSLPRADSLRLAGTMIRRRALQCTASIQGLLVLAKWGLSEAEIREMRDAADRCSACYA